MEAEKDNFNLREHRVVRVFISSTFSDMHAERDHLVAVVFPELRERLERIGLDFFDVDLRWGVPKLDVDGERANSWKYCKQSIKQVEAFFICLLGERYGYIPPADDILDTSDRQIFAGLSITEMEIRHAVLSGKMSRHSFFYLRQSLVPEKTPESIYKEFVEPQFQDKLEKLKTGIKDQSRFPVREYDCRWNGSSFEEMDEFGQKVLEDLWSGVLRDERFVPVEVWEKVLGEICAGIRFIKITHSPFPKLSGKNWSNRSSPSL